MYEQARADAVTQLTTDQPELAALLDEGEPWALPFIFAPDLVRLLCASETPAELSRVVLEFIRGMEIITQVHYETIAGATP